MAAEFSWSGPAGVTFPGVVTHCVIRTAVNLDPAWVGVDGRDLFTGAAGLQDAHVLLYPEGMVKLNGSAGAIMSRCDGVRSVADIIADIEKTFALTGIGADVRAFVAMALERHWLELAP